MAKKGFKASALKQGNGGSGSNIDWKAIHDQVDEGTHSARISVMVDLGTHTESMALSNKGQTGFLTEEDAQQWLDEMEEKYGKKHDVFKNGAPDIEDADDVAEIGKYTKTLQLEEDGEWTVLKNEEPLYIVEANEFGGEREYQEMAIFADLVENPVDYGPEIGEKPFRVMLNNRWKGEIKGFQLKPSKPTTKDGVWTVKGNTQLAQLATATDKKHLLEVDLKEADWSEILGEGLNIGIDKAGDEGQYLNVGKFVALKKRKGVVEEIEELENEPVLILFDDVTADELEAAHIRGDIIKKIKSANNYAGSVIEKAIKEFEKRQKAKFEAAKGSAADEDEGDNDDDGEEKEERKVTKVKKAPAKKTKPKAEPEPDENDGEGNGEGNDEEWGD